MNKLGEIKLVKHENSNIYKLLNETTYDFLIDVLLISSRINIRLGLIFSSFFPPFFRVHFFPTFCFCVDLLFFNSFDVKFMSRTTDLIYSALIQSFLIENKRKVS